MLIGKTFQFEFNHPFGKFILKVTSKTSRPCEVSTDNEYTSIATTSIKMTTLITHVVWCKMYRTISFNWISQYVSAAANIWPDNIFPIWINIFPYGLNKMTFVLKLCKQKMSLQLTVWIAYWQRHIVGSNPDVLH
jgi:hypothetical protein